MDSYETRLFRELERRIREDVTKKTEAVAAGTPGDFPVYKGICGEIRGMNNVLSIMAQIETDERKGASKGGG